ncbi:MAG: TIR domain-containing protein, partial [Acidimicrobiales bacterium]
MRIFMSYRRADVGGHAGRLSDSLVQRLGPRNVFQDVTDIAAGRDFLTVIRGELDGCDAAIAVIGPGWLTAATPEGRPRLFEPDDYVRLELATVLQRDLPVVPVLVGGAALPAAEALPEDLRPLAQRQAIEVRDSTWHQDVDHLLRSLRGEPVAAAAPAGRRRAAV